MNRIKGTISHHMPEIGSRGGSLSITGEGASSKDSAEAGRFVSPQIWFGFLGASDVIIHTQISLDVTHVEAIRSIETILQARNALPLKTRPNSRFTAGSDGHFVGEGFGGRKMFNFFAPGKRCEIDTHREVRRGGRVEIDDRVVEGMGNAFGYHKVVDL